MTDAEQIAAFIARKGVTRIAEGDTALGYAPRDWHKVVRAEQAQAIDPAHERHVATIDRYGRSVIVNGLGEHIATE